MKRRKIIRHSAAYLALGVLIIIALFPYFWMITCAIRDQNEIFISPPKLWSSNVSLDSFERILTETKLPRYMLNSLITSLMATAMCIFCAIPAGYALARFQFKGKNTVTTGILLVKLLPQTATLIPLYIMLVNVRLINNSFGLAFTHLFIMVPYTIWMSSAAHDFVGVICRWPVCVYAFVGGISLRLYLHRVGSIQDHYRWPLYADRRGYQRLGRHYGRFHHDGSARADFLFQRSGYIYQGNCGRRCEGLRYLPACGQVGCRRAWRFCTFESALDCCTPKFLDEI